MQSCLCNYGCTGTEIAWDYDKEDLEVKEKGKELDVNK